MVKRVELKPGRYTIKQVIDSTRTNFAKQDWARSQARGRHFDGDKGLIYNTKINVGRPIRTPWGIRFQTTTTDPISFGTDAKGRYPRKWIQYIEFPSGYEKNNVNGLKAWRIFCTCPRFAFGGHHYVLWQAGHAPKPKGKAMQAPDWNRRGSRAAATCKHGILALLAVQKLSRVGQIPMFLPDNKWLEIERFWQKAEAGGNGPAAAYSENLKNAPISVQNAAKRAQRLAQQRKPVMNSRASDWSNTNFKNIRPK